MLISANRHLSEYAALAPVVSDRLDATGAPHSEPDYAGPLAGIVAALATIDTPWLACIPCDAPHLPADLVARLGQGLISPPTSLSADLSVPHPPALLSVAATQRDGMQQIHPVCALMHVSLRDASAALLARGERRLMTWLAHHNGRVVDFDDDGAFYNINTRQALDHDTRHRL